jgi:hypothetical protein
MRARASEARPSGAPSQRSSPFVGGTSVERMPSSVVLPAPLGPSTALTRPGTKVVLTSMSARRFA